MAEAFPNLPSLQRQMSLSTHQETNRLNILKTAFYVLLLLCLALSLFSWHTWKHTDSKTLLAILVSCLITKIGSLLGIIGSFKSIQDLRYSDLSLNSVRISTGHQILMIAFYFLIMMLMAFIIFGTRALFYSDRSIAYLEARYNSDFHEWEMRYGESSLESMEKWALLMTNVAGYTCYIIVGFIVLIIYLLLAITMTYGIVNSIISLISLGILVLGWSIVYMLIYAVMFRQQMGFDISITMLAVTVLLALSLGIIAVFGYVLALSDNKNYLKPYFFLCVVGIFLSIFSFSESVAVSRSLVTQLGEECYDFMSMVDQKYINSLGCGEKYLNVTNTDLLSCEKNRQRYIWEERGSYGCLNTLCCQVLITDSKAKFDYLAICSMCAVVMVLISLWTCYYFYYKEVDEPAPQDKRILVALVGLSLLWVYLITFHLPPVPETVPYMNAAAIVSGATVVDQRLLHAGYCISLDSLDFVSEKCEDCSKVEYFLAIQGGKVLKPDNTTANEYMTMENDLEKIKFDLNKAKLCPICGNEIWTIEIQRLDYIKDENTTKSVM